LPSRLNAAEQAHQKRIQEARAAALSLQAALGKLDAADKGPKTKMLIHQLGRWLGPSPQSTPTATPANQEGASACRRACRRRRSAFRAHSPTNADRCFFAERET